MTNSFENAGCVIMASGLATRYGDNKLMADLNGQPLISHIINTSKQLFKHSVVVTRHKSVEEYCKSINQPVILHAFPGRNDTTRLGTECLKSKNVDKIIFFQGDQPLVSVSSIEAILKASNDNPEKIVRLSFNGSDCAPVLFPSIYFEDLLNLPENKGGNYIANKKPQNLLRIEAKYQYETFDVDTKDDMNRISEILKSSI